MTLEEYSSLPRIGPREVHFINAASVRSRPPVARSSTLARLVTGPARRIGAWRPCDCCGKLTFVFRPTDRCVACTAQIEWQLSLARQGLRVVWNAQD
jgi:hypothetical protein